MTKLIGLYSPVPGCGKTTLADGLLGHGYVRRSFAAPLKAMLRTLLDHQGVPALRIHRMLDGDLKEVPAPELAGRTPRRAMQALGTEWGRDCLGPDFWAAAALAECDLALTDGRGVVIDDVRFPNEADAIRARGGLLVRITRPGLAAQGGHVSEGGLEGYRFDLELANAFAGPREWVLEASAAIAKHQGAR